MSCRSGRRREIGGEYSYPNVLRIELGGVHIIHDLVGSKEGQCVRVTLEVLHIAKHILQIALVVGGPRILTVDAHHGRVHVHNDVDTCAVEYAHAHVMVDLRVHVVHANGVDLWRTVASAHRSGILLGCVPKKCAPKHTYTQFLQQSRIPETRLLVGKDVGVGFWIKAGLGAWLVAVVEAVSAVDLRNGVCGGAAYSTPTIISRFFDTVSTNSLPTTSTGFTAARVNPTSTARAGMVRRSMALVDGGNNEMSIPVEIPAEQQSCKCVSRRSC